jgi:hypothetical protein
LNQAGFDTGIDLIKLMQAVKFAEKIVHHPVGGKVRPYLEKNLA